VNSVTRERVGSFTQSIKEYSPEDKFLSVFYVVTSPPHPSFRLKAPDEGERGYRDGIQSKITLLIWAALTTRSEVKLVNYVL
jgi:hypothetical protein